MALINANPVFNVLSSSKRALAALQARAARAWQAPLAVMGSMTLREGAGVVGRVIIS